MSININNIINKKTTQEQFKPKPVIKYYFPIISKGLYDSFQIDLMDMSNLASRNKNVNFLLCAIDIFSRKAWVEPLKNKTNESVTTAMSKILDKQKCNIIESDLGSEFVSKQFRKLMTDHKIQIIYADVADHHAQGIVERFNGTLRRIINKYMTSEDTFNYIDALPDIINYYNNKYHKGIKGTPNNPDERLIDEINRQKMNMARSTYKEFKVGDHVRALLVRKVFVKNSPVWSSVVHTIKEKNKSGFSYILDNDKKYKYYELLKVDKPTKEEPKPKADFQEIRDERTIKRRITKEGIEQNPISIRRSARERKPVSQLENSKYGNILYS
jgi:hypothetical protein